MDLIVATSTDERQNNKSYEENSICAELFDNYAKNFNIIADSIEKDGIKPSVLIHLIEIAIVLKKLGLNV